MQGWLRYLRLRAQSKTGLSPTLLVWVLIAVPCGVLGLCFLILATFVWLAERYGPLYAALILGCVFVLVTLVALAAAVASHRRTMREAELALAVQRRPLWVDPGFMRVGLQAGRAIGARKLIPLLAVGVLAAGLGMRWFGRARPNDAEADTRRVTARAA